MDIDRLGTLVWDVIADLTNVLRALSKEIGLGEDLTDSRGFLVRDPSRIICDDWRQAADGS